MEYVIGLAVVLFIAWGFWKTYKKVTTPKTPINTGVGGGTGTGESWVDDSPPRPDHQQR